MDPRSENLRIRVAQNSLRRTNPEEATKQFKEKLRTSKDPREYMSPFFEDMLDEDDIKFINEWAKSHAL